MHLEVFFSAETMGLENVDGEPSLSHRIHGTGVFTYIWPYFLMANVGKYTLIHGSYGYTSWFLRFLVLTYLLVSVNLAGKDSMGKTWGIWFVRRCIFIAGDDRERFQLFLLHLRVTTLFWVFKNTQPGNSWCVKTGTQLTSRDPGKYPSSSPPNATFFETQKRNRLHWICP